jgi:glycosyltransferase involved in cell wall biosynthesis
VEKVKIALLTLCFNKDNNEAMNITSALLAKALSKKGHEVFIFSHRNIKELKFEKLGGVNIVRYWPRLSLNLHHKLFFLDPFMLVNHIFAQIEGLKYAKKKLNKDFEIIINTASSPLISLRSFFAKKLFPNAKVIMLIKSISLFKSFNFYSLLNVNDFLITPSINIRKILLRNNVKKPIKIINSPINTEKFIPLNKQELKKKYNYKNKKILLYYGHFNKFKGVEFLIKSLNYIKTKEILLLLIPSKNNDKNLYNELIKKEKLKDKIKVLDSNINIVDFVNMADVAIFPYPSLVSTEANPSCVLECLACKIPVITSDLPQLREILIHKHTALLAKLKNPRDIARNIDLVLNSTILRTKLIKNGFMISKKFSIKNISENYLKLFEKRGK